VFAANFATAWASASAHALWSAVFSGLLTATYAAAAWLVRPADRTAAPAGRPARHGGVLRDDRWRAPRGGADRHHRGDRDQRPAQPVALPGIYALGPGIGWIGDASGLLTVVPAAVVSARPWLDGTQPARSTPLAPAVLRGAVLLRARSRSCWRCRCCASSAPCLSFLPLVWICVYHGLRRRNARHARR
jgi:hypothetical protein